MGACRRAGDRARRWTRHARFGRNLQTLVLTRSADADPPVEANRRSGPGHRADDRASRVLHRHPAADRCVEGGGGFVIDGKGIAHFLFEDTAAARKVLEAKGITVLEDREVLIQRLKQDQPGQLGKIARMMSDAGVNIEVMYSDHQNQLILVVDDFKKGRVVSEAWKK